MPHFPHREVRPRFFLRGFPTKSKIQFFWRTAMSINQDRPCTCAFFFADGRRCQLPPSADDMGLCYFHAKKYHDRLTAEEAGQQINQYLSSSDILTACDLSSALTTLFSATALGLIKPKTTFALTALGQLMLQTQRLAKQEFLESFDDRWPQIVQESICFNEPAPPPAPAATEPADPSDSGPSDNPDADPTATGIHPLPSRKIM